MARSDIRDRIGALGTTNQYIIEQIFREKGERITQQQFSTAINKTPGLWQPREVKIVQMAREILDKLEAERGSIL